MDLVALIVVSGLIALNALFVAAEFAIVAAPRTAVVQLADQGSQRAKAVARVQADPRSLDRYIATAQLGITMASLGLGMYGELRLALWIEGLLSWHEGPGWLASHALASGLALLALTYFHIVLGEMVPKAVALARAVPAALWSTPIMLGLQWATHPFVAALNGIGNAILRFAGIDRRMGRAHLYSSEELRYLVREAHQGGMLRLEAAAVVDELLEFGELVAREAMVPRVRIRGVEIGATLADLMEVVTAAPHARYPVYADDLDHIVGMIHIREIARCVREGTTLRQSEVRPIPFVPGSASLDAVLEAMHVANVQMAVVMDEHGGTDGILTTEDLFEEVIGDIQDPVSEDRPEFYVAEDGSQRVAGTARIEDLGERIGRPLGHDDVDTVSGLVLALLDRPPSVADRVRYAGVELEVLKVSGFGVAECRASLYEAADGEADEAEPKRTPAGG